MSRTRILALLLSATLITAMARAQFANPHDKSPLRPPPGVRVAIFEFADLQCPDCARANPLLEDASAKYHIPILRHDFPLPMHNWSFDAAVDARWFDSKAVKGHPYGDEFRAHIFAHQQEIHSPDDVRAYAQGFAQAKGLQFPFVVDPQGQFAAKVNEDKALGQRIGIEHTPTIWVVTNKTTGVPFVEVVDRTHLYEIIDQALAETRASK